MTNWFSAKHAPPKIPGKYIVWSKPTGQLFAAWRGKRWVTLGWHAAWIDGPEFWTFPPKDPPDDVG